MLVLSLAAIAAPPTTAEQVDALLRQLIDADAGVRIAAARGLMGTPPALVGRLQVQTIDPACAALVADRRLEKLSATCQRWNHAMYHYLRVVGALAKDSTDPSTALGRWCLPRSQPHDGDRVQDPACGLIGSLRWVLVDAFDQADLLDPTELDAGVVLPEAVATEALEASARKDWEAAYRPVIDAGNVASFPAWSVTKGSRTFRAIPICSGHPGNDERCALHLVVSDGDRFEHTAAMPSFTLTGPAEPGAPVTNLRMTTDARALLSEDGRYGVLLTDGGCCDSHTRNALVYDLQGPPKLHCTVSGELEDMEARPPFVVPTIDASGCRW